MPIAIRRVNADSQNPVSHPHDLTEVEHSHDFSELVIVTSGHAIQCLEGTEFPVGAGDIFVLQGRQRHYFHTRTNLALINIMYAPDRLGFPENELRRMPGYCAMFMLEPTYRRQHRFASRLHLDRVPLAHVERLIDEMETESSGKGPGYEIVLRAKLLELFVYLSRSYSGIDSREAQALLRLGDVIGALENNPARDWNLDDLTKIAHMSRSSLMRTFRKATGQTPIEYLLRIRIQRAMELLRSSALSITEIAIRTGFNDSNYFSRQFRHITGDAPRDFRRKNV